MELKEVSGTEGSAKNFRIETQCDWKMGSVEPRTISVLLRDSSIEYKVSALKSSSFKIVIASASHMFA